MERLKAIFLYVLALIVLLAPAIILGWIGLTLLEGVGLGWLGLIVGVVSGLGIFYASVKKIAKQEEQDDDWVEETQSEEQPVLSSKG